MFDLELFLGVSIILKHVFVVLPFVVKNFYSNLIVALLLESLTQAKRFLL
jgi:hypothetical protein